MDEAEPQPATGKAPDEQALEALRLQWGQSYWIGCDDERGWRAQRRDGLGGDITAETPDELNTAIGEDHALKPAGTRSACPAPTAAPAPRAAR